MRFERVLENGRLWAVMYDEDCVNILEKVFTQWNDYEWLREFFTKHVDDLATFFHITDIDRAVFDTVDDANELECLIMDLNPDADLDELFRPLENTRMSEVILGREKAKVTMFVIQMKNALRGLSAPAAWQTPEKFFI